MHDFQFYIPPEKINDNLVTINGEEYRHCCRVLRKNRGDIIKVFDGYGFHYGVRILNIYENYAEGKIIKSYPKEKSIFPELFLGVGTVKNSTLDTIVNQVSSLGVAHFYSLLTRHSVKRGFKKERFKKIAIKSVKQCGSAYLPEIHDQINFDDWLDFTHNIKLKLIAEKDNSMPLLKVVNRVENIGEIAVMVGPEGGFSSNEIKTAEANGFIPVNISERRLRTELAVVVMLANIYPLDLRVSNIR